VSSRFRAPDEIKGRLGWKIYGLVIAWLYLGGLRQGMHQDALAWLDWTATFVGAFALAGLTAYAWRLPGGGFKFWRLIATADLAVLLLGFWAMFERTQEQFSWGIFIGAMVIASVIHLPEVVAVWRFGGSAERFRGR
jgi:hypothetical protein